RASGLGTPSFIAGYVYGISRLQSQTSFRRPRGETGSIPHRIRPPGPAGGGRKRSAEGTPRISSLLPQSEQPFVFRFLMALHARCDLAGGRDCLAIRRDGGIDPTGVGARRLRVEFHHDEQVGLLRRLENFVALPDVRIEVVALLMAPCA